MKKLIFNLLVFILGLGATAYGQQALSPRNANYDIEVQLDTATHTLQGQMTLHWRNISQDTLNELQFHLYLNAFKDANSTLMQESGLWRRLNPDNPEHWGEMTINSMKITGAENLTRKIRFIAPDDNNPNDQTVCSVALTDSVYPEQTIPVEINFTTRLPQKILRSGFYNSMYMVAQWFPKIGVYDAQKHQWNCHQYHASSEFFSDFGVYRVKITVPSAFVVGATGLLIKEEDSYDNRKTLTFLAEDVIDFAWTASPDYHFFTKEKDGVTINLLLLPEHLDQAGRFFNMVVESLDFYKNFLKPYPYPVITIADQPLLAGGGMEYPMFFTVTTLAHLPNNIRWPELMTVHELTHQFFMGMVATNEFEEAWLDEGITSYYEYRLMEHIYGEEKAYFDLGSLYSDGTDYHRSKYLSMKNLAASGSVLPTWELPAGATTALIYNKPATMLITLERLVGRAVMDTIMQTYVERWQFKHPKTADFVAVANEVVQREGVYENMDWFFEQALFGSAICDYAITSVQYHKNESTGNYESVIKARRLKDMKIPIEVRMEFNDGTYKIEHWDGASAEKMWRYEQHSRIVSAYIDPERKILLDKNLNNNGMLAEDDHSIAWKYALKALFWLQNTFFSFGFFV